MSQIERKADIHVKRRVKLLAVVFCILCFTAILARLAYLQIIRQDFYKQKALSSQTRDVTIYPKRGTIYDTNGKPLAISASTEMLILSPRQLRPQKYGDLLSAEKRDYLETHHLTSRDVDEKTELAPETCEAIREKRLQTIVEALPALLELNAETILQKAEKDSAYQVLLRGVEKDQADPVRQFIQDNKYTGFLYFEADSTRYYPYGSFLASVLGCVGSDEQGLAGLERQYDQFLTGTPGRAVSLTDTHGNAITEDYELYYEAQDGSSLVLTIDEVLQHYLEKHLEIAYSDNQVKGSAIGVVMDVNDGGILAMASYPEYDPNHPFVLSEEKEAEVAAIEDEEARKKARSDAVYQMWSNKGVSFLYYPGSTFKIITMASALEEGVVTENSHFYCSGSKLIEGWSRPIGCWKKGGHGDETLRDALKNSCNPALMTIGQALGIQKFGDYASAFGVRSKTGVDLPGEELGIFNLRSGVDLAVYSFGQNFSLTPLQLVTAVSAVANGGTLLRPHIVKEILNADGTVAQSFGRTEVRQVISEQTSDLMRDMLEDVVKTGTGKNAYVAGYRVAGKTGTTENIERKTKDGEDVYVTSFVAFAPADYPRIAVLILLDEPTVLPISGGLNTAPVVRRFLEEALPYLEVEPVYTEAEKAARNVIMPDFTGMTLSEAEAALKKLGLTCQSSGAEAKVTDQIPAAGSTVAGGSKAVLYLGGGKPDKVLTVPDLSGMTLSRARTTLQNMGLYVRVSGGVSEGSQTVTKQDTEASAQVEYGAVITVETTDMNQRAQ